MYLAQLFLSWFFHEAARSNLNAFVQYIQLFPTALWNAFSMRILVAPSGRLKHLVTDEAL